MVKFSDLFCNKSLGSSGQHYLAPFQRHSNTLLMSELVSMTLDGVTSFFSCQQRKKIHVNDRITVKTVDGNSLCDGRKLEESEGYNYFFVVFYVLESK